MLLGKLRHLARVSYHYAFPRLVFARYIQDHRADEIEMDYLPALVNRNRDAIDVGANLGRYSIRLASLARKVWAFEPHPRLARILARSLPSNVIVQQAAVSNYPGVAELRIPIKEDQQVESLGTLEPESNSDLCYVTSVERITLDQFSSHDIGFIKIDVEGHELSVIGGSLELVLKQRPAILVEADDHHRIGATASLFQLMASIGYQGLFIFRNKVLDIGEFDALTMQNESTLRSKAPRKDCPYVNNFIFVPEKEALLFRARLATFALDFKSRTTVGFVT